MTCRLYVSLPVIREPLVNLALNLQAFFRVTWSDWILIAIIGAVAAGVWISPHTFTRLIPVSDSPDPESLIYWPSLAHPYHKPIFSAPAAGFLSAVLPLCSFALAQIWVDSFVDFASAVLGLTYSMVTGSCFQVILKKTIGGLRPHFLAVCQPVLPSKDDSHGVGYRGIMYTAEQICTGDKHHVTNALESFPSGHAEVAFAGLGFLAVYLFTHLKIASPRRERSGAYWRMLAVIAPLFLATFESATLVLGYHHHGYDVLFGALIGAVMAILGYRMVYRGLWDEEQSTVPYLYLPERKQVGESRRGRHDTHGSGQP